MALFILCLDFVWFNNYSIHSISYLDSTSNLSIQIDFFQTAKSWITFSHQNLFYEQLERNILRQEKFFFHKLFIHRKLYFIVTSRVIQKPYLHIYFSKFPCVSLDSHLKNLRVNHTLAHREKSVYWEKMNIYTIDWENLFSPCKIYRKKISGKDKYSKTSDKQTSRIADTSK